MPFLRNLLHDLVAKRLWPVAVLLIAALAAVPIVLGGSSKTSNDIASIPAPATNGTKDATTKVVSLEEPVAGSGAVTRDGKVRDPFVQHHVPKPTKEQDTAAVQQAAAQDGAAASSGGATPDEAATPDASTQTGTTKSPAKSESTATATDTYSVTLKFGEEGTMKTYKDVARLTPLPSSTNPFFVFLGLSDDGKKAVFLVDAEAIPTGDGTCQPSEDSCEQVALKVGDIELLELQSGTGGVVQYQLELTSITSSKAPTKATAAAAHARESSAGREYLRQAVADDPSLLDNWDYSTATGLLVSKAPVASVPADVADAADGRSLAETATTFTVPSK